MQYKKKPYKFNKKSFEIVLYQHKTSFVVDRKETEEMLKKTVKRSERMSHTKVRGEREKVVIISEKSKKYNFKDYKNICN